VRTPTILGIVLAAAIGLTGCMVAPVVPPQGIVFTNFKAPLDLDQNQTPVSSKTGKAEVMNILNLFSWGDGSIQAAAKNGGIETIESADYEYFTILGLFHKYTTVVHGK
jgi:hypothetical protein